jgi:nicotinamide-nucleotide amidase
MAGLRELMLREPRLALAVAESVTCGRLQARVGTASGASEFFSGGITAYTLDQKARHLGVERERAAAVDCVSREVAEQMARGACRLFGTRVGVATTGYAEPSPDRGVGEPFAWWAVEIGGAGTSSGRVDCPGATRVEAQERIAEAAYAALVERLSLFRSR